MTTAIPFPTATALPENNCTPTPVLVLYVAVPRAVFDKYWPLPWAEVVAAAHRGDDDLTPETTAPRVWRGNGLDGPVDRPDVAFLREGTIHGRRGCTLLYQQNW